MNTKTIRSYVIVSFVSVCSYITQDFFFITLGKWISLFFIVPSNDIGN